MNGKDKPSAPNSLVGMLCFVTKRKSNSQTLIVLLLSNLIEVYSFLAKIKSLVENKQDGNCWQRSFFYITRYGVNFLMGFFFIRRNSSTPVITLWCKEALAYYRLHGFFSIGLMSRTVLCYVIQHHTQWKDNSMERFHYLYRNIPMIITSVYNSNYIPNKHRFNELIPIICTKISKYLNVSNSNTPRRLLCILHCYDIIL